MEVRSSTEAKTTAEDFAKRYLELQLQKKIIDKDIKALQEECKENGVPVGVVKSVINQIKKESKQTDSERFELDTIHDWLDNNTDIKDKIGQLIAKD